MADLLSSLEVGMTRVVGAASRIRNQITIIEEYMKTQSQQNLVALASNPQYIKQGLADAENPNIDPVLQTPGNMTGQYQHSQSDFQFKGDFGNGITPNVEQPADEFQFQLPPELLERWPWPFDMSHGFGTA